MLPSPLWLAAQDTLQGVSDDGWMRLRVSVSRKFGTDRQTDRHVPLRRASSSLAIFVRLASFSLRVQIRVGGQRRDVGRRVADGLRISSHDGGGCSFCAQDIYSSRAVEKGVLGVWVWVGIQ